MIVWYTLTDMANQHMWMVWYPWGWYKRHSAFNGSQAGRQKRWAENVTQKVQCNMKGKKTWDPHLQHLLQVLANRMVLPFLPEIFLSTSLISVHIPEFLKNTNLTFRHWLLFIQKGHKNISSFTFEFLKHTERRTVKYKLTCQNMGHYGAASTHYPLFFFSGQ